MRKGNVLLKVNDVHFESDNIWKPVTGVLENQSVWFGWSKDGSSIDSALLMFKEVDSDRVNRVFLNVFTNTSINRYHESIALKTIFKNYLTHGHLEGFRFDYEDDRNEDDHYNQSVDIGTSLTEMGAYVGEVIQKFATHRLDRVEKIYKSESMKLSDNKDTLKQQFKRFL